MKNSSLIKTVNNCFRSNRGEFILVSYSSDSSVNCSLAKMWANLYEEKILNGPMPFTRFSCNLVFANSKKLRGDFYYYTKFITLTRKNGNNKLIVISNPILD